MNRAAPLSQRVMAEARVWSAAHPGLPFRAADLRFEDIRTYAERRKIGVAITVLAKLGFLDRVETGLYRLPATGPAAAAASAQERMWKIIRTAAGAFTRNDLVELGGVEAETAQRFLDIAACRGLVSKTRVGTVLQDRWSYRLLADQIETPDLLPPPTSRVQSVLRSAREITRSAHQLMQDAADLQAAAADLLSDPRGFGGGDRPQPPATKKRGR